MQNYAVFVDDMKDASQPFQIAIALFHRRGGCSAMGARRYTSKADLAVDLKLRLKLPDAVVEKYLATPDLHEVVTDLPLSDEVVAYLGS
jgi:hypothetical protein